MARRDGLTGDREAWGVKLDFPNDLWDIAASFRRVGEGFDPSLGFVPRKAVEASRFSLTYAPRLEGTGEGLERVVGEGSVRLAALIL